MVARRTLLTRVFGRGCFPHQFAWLIDNPLRRLLLTPQELADRLSLTEADRVLEVGPGSGYFSLELARRIPDGRIELLDLQPEMLAKVRRKLDTQGIRNVGYTTDDASARIPFSDQSFDVTLLVCVLGEVQDAKACLRELFRILRFGGLLAIHEHVPDPDRISFSALRPFVESEGFRFQKRWGPPWNYTATFERPPHVSSAV